MEGWALDTDADTDDDSGTAKGPPKTKVRARGRKASLERCEAAATGAHLVLPAVRGSPAPAVVAPALWQGKAQISPRVSATVAAKAPTAAAKTPTAAAKIATAAVGVAPAGSKEKKEQAARPPRDREAAAGPAIGDGNARALLLRGSSIRDRSVRDFVQRLKGGGILSLQELRLTDTRIGDAGMSVLAQALRSNRSLTSLDVSGSLLGNVGASKVAAALQQSGAIAHVVLARNNIGAAGAVALSTVLDASSDTNHCELVSLDLQHNSGVGDEGAAALGGVLEENDVLTALRLDGCRIGDEGARALAQGLAESGGTLAVLGLRFNAITAAGASEFGTVLAQGAAAAESLTDLNLNLWHLRCAGMLNCRPLPPITS